MSATPEIDSSSAEAITSLRRQCPPGSKIVFVSGNFNIVHPGHLRLLNFAAECGDVLVVGVHPDGYGNTLIPEQLRLEAVKAISVVDFAMILREAPHDFIHKLRPAVVVKGKEHEGRYNPELAELELYGGKLLFSSGDARFSSLDLLQKEYWETNFSTIEKPTDYAKRHQFQIRELIPVVKQFGGLRAVVLGDLIVDEYINCDPLGMSQEDPTLVVMPNRVDRFIGGAGIVAAHARGLGAEVTYLCVTGNDPIADFSRDTLQNYNVNCKFFIDESRPTTLKQRYRARNKTLLRVSHLRQHDISTEIAQNIFNATLAALDKADILIFADFNYGSLPQHLVDSLVDICTQRGILMVADSQASSQIGDVSRFKKMTLLTPTEHEARLATQDRSAGLVVLAEALRIKAETQHVLVTLGSEGLLIQTPDVGVAGLTTDRLPAFNTSPKDVSGAGDSLMTCTALALALGIDIWRAAYIGSVAAACQVSRLGNLPLSADDLIKELSL